MIISKSQLQTVSCLVSENLLPGGISNMVPERCTTLKETDKVLWCCVNPFGSYIPFYEKPWPLSHIAICVLNFVPDIYIYIYCLLCILCISFGGHTCISVGSIMVCDWREGSVELRWFPLSLIIRAYQRAYI